MIMGRSTSGGRKVGLWDDVAVSRNLNVGGNLVVSGYTETKVITFSAYLDSNSRTGNKSPLPLQQTSRNKGNAYNRTTSKFKAPVKGTYLFTMTMYKVSGSYVRWYLRRNTTYVNTGGSTSSENSERCLVDSYHNSISASRTVITVLNANDEIWIEQVGDGRCDNYRSGLEGILLSADV